MKYLFTIVVILISNLSLGQVEKTSDTLEIWTVFSIGNFINQNAEKIIEKNWPFKIKGIAGDAFSEELIDDIQMHNEKVWNYLDSNGYSDSKKTFETDLLSEIKRIKNAVEISNSNPEIADLLITLKNNKRQNHTELTKINVHTYQFKLYSFEVDKPENGEKLEKIFRVNVVTNTIE
ncbi:hypothetical protein BXY82_3019 [Gelidibacter sediminis]|uniref:Uncharacterized protein n=1 Tax=Gelidibacter sediminis TaxID=1608710 RepID=A0A4R7PHC8_9FLAO|nr:hypothetical protein [Gelidibacter sediminis]TDU33723.1 hypothetical protein BXY82_3019 [Gelidibacter sediminis]